MIEPPVSVPPPDTQARAAERGPTVPAPPDPDAPPACPCFTLGEMSARGEPELPGVDVDTMRRIYLDLALPHLRLDPPGGPGYRLLQAVGRTFSWADIPLAGGEGYAVLGSHRRCDLVLTDDVAISPRHLVAVLVRLFEDDPDSRVLRLIDLGTGVPILLNDNRPRPSVDAPFAVRVGRHVICGLPVAPAAAANDPGAAGGDELGADRERVPAPLSPPDSCVSGSPTRVRLTVQRDSLGASVELPMQALDNGIVLGRALHCFDDGLGRVLDDGAVSGTHLLVLRDGADVLAFDLCSTNGTRLAGQRVRRHRFTDAEPAIELGKKVVLSITCLKG